MRVWPARLYSTYVVTPYMYMYKLYASYLVPEVQQHILKVYSPRCSPALFDLEVAEPTAIGSSVTVFAHWSIKGLGIYNSKVESYMPRPNMFVLIILLLLRVT